MDLYEEDAEHVIYAGILRLQLDRNILREAFYYGN